MGTGANQVLLGRGRQHQLGSRPTLVSITIANDIIAMEFYDHRKRYVRPREAPHEKRSGLSTDPRGMWSVRTSTQLRRGPALRWHLGGTCLPGPCGYRHSVSCRVRGGGRWV